MQWKSGSNTHSWICRIINLSACRASSPGQIGAAAVSNVHYCETIKHSLWTIKHLTVMYHLLLQHIIILLIWLSYYWYDKTKDNPGNFKHFTGGKIILYQVIFRSEWKIFLWLNFGFDNDCWKKYSKTLPKSQRTWGQKNYLNKIQTSYDKLILIFFKVWIGKLGWASLVVWVGLVWFGLVQWIKISILPSVVN